MHFFISYPLFFYHNIYIYYINLLYIHIFYGGIKNIFSFVNENLYYLLIIKFFIMKKSLWIVFMLTTSYLSAQDAETVKDTVSESKLEQLTKNFTLGGSADAYSRQNISGPNGEDAIAPRTAFADQNGFALGMVNVFL